MEKIKITNFYRPNQSGIFKMNSYYQDDHEVKSEEVNCNYPKDLKIETIADSTSNNKTYQNLIWALDIGTSEARDILKLIEDRWMPREYNFLSSFTPLTTEEELGNQTVIEDHLVIAKLFIQKWTVGRVCKELQLEKHHVCKLMRRFRKNLQTIKIDNRKYLHKSRKLSEDHLRTLSEVTASLSGAKFTVKDVKSWFENKLMNQASASESTIRRRMKDYLRLGYKRCGVLNKSTRSDPKINEILEAIALQVELERQGFKIIFIDEFRFSSESYTEYGWTKRGSCGHHFVSYSRFNMSFMIGFSVDRIEGVVATNGTFNSKKFRKLIIDTLKDGTSNSVIIMDNAKIHKVLDVNNFCKERGMLMITIPTYSPFLNPWEKLILRIKSAARKIKASRKVVTLQTFRGVFDGIRKDSLRDWIKDSMTETYDFIKEFSKQ